MSKHTPGPWVYVDGAGVTHASNDFLVQTGHSHGTRSWSRWIARADHGHTFDADSDNAANMRLIAAAPDLLEALRAYFDHVVHKNQGFTQAEIEAQMRAAIAKATGGES